MQRSKTAAVALAFLAAMVTFQVGRPDDVVSTGDDLDGDSVPDEVAANPDGEGAGPSPGVVYVSSGEDGGLIVKFEGGRDGDLFGYAVHSSTDFDLDGFKDLIIGAPNDGTGRAYVFYGPFLDTGPLVITADSADLSFRSPAPDQLDFGYLVGPVTDLDCDGLPDIRIGSVSVGPGGGEGPGTFIVSGLTGEPLLFVEGDDPFDAWAPVTGDADGDADVDQSDIDLIVTNQGQQAFGAFEGDVNGDGVVDPSDIGIAQDHLGADGFSGMDVGICRLPCDDPPPAGWHCVVDCDGEPIELPENVWPECDPCITIGGGCYVELYDGLMAFPQGSTIEIVPQTIIGGGEIDQWVILVGAERVEVLSGLSDIPLILRLDEPGPVTLRLDWQACFDLCGDEMTFHISTPGDWDGDGYSDACEQSEGSDWMDFFDVPGFPIEDDPDNDGLTNGEECSLGTDRLDYDSDGDGLPDGWEVEYGLDPLDEDSDDNGVADTFEDPDGDGLSNHDEFIYGSDPTEGDSDGDGVSDGDEVAQGSDPNDPSDEGIAPDPDDLLHGNVSIGDPSGSHSELWMLKVGDRRYKAPGYGEVICFADELFRRGESYQVQLVHLGSSLQPPDLDHIAWIDVLEDGECILLDDPDGILTPLPDGLCSSEQSEYEPYRSESIPPGSFDDERATLLGLGIDLDIDSDNSNGFGSPDRSGAEEEAENLNPSPGKLVGANTRNLDDDPVPDFADGYDLDGQPGTHDDASDGVQFVPMVLDPGEIDWNEIDPESVTMTFGYAASDPLAVVVDGSCFEPAPGRLRLWTAGGSEPRSGRAVSDVPPGNFVPAGEVTAADLGFEPGVTTVTIWVEGIAPTQDQTNDLITVTCSLDEMICDDDAVRVRVYDLELVTFDEDTGSVVPAESVTGPSNLAPELTISLSDARVAENGDLILTVSGHVQDRLSELADDPAQRLQEVRFYVNGELVDVLGGLPALSPGSGIMPWQPYLLDVEFTRTITVGAAFGLARPSGINLVARTSQNAAGHIATDRVEAAIQWWLLEDLLPSSGIAVENPRLTLAFIGDPDPAAVDLAWAYIGDREPLPTDGILTEEGPDAHVFSGNLLFPEDLASVPCAVAIEGDLDFSPDGVDVFTASVTYEFSETLTYSAVTTWTETAADSLRFLQDTILVPNATQIGDDPEGPSYAVPILAVAQDVDFTPEGPNGWIARYAVRATGLDDESAALLWGVVNGFEVPMEPFAFSPIRYYFVDEDDHGRPRIFVITVEDLPQGIDAIKPNGLFISNDEIREHRIALRQVGEDPSQYITQELFEDDFGPPPDEIGEPSGEPVTLPVLLTYFGLIYSDTGVEMLEMFQNGGGEIAIDDQWFWERDLDVSYYGTSFTPSMKIEIDEHLDPVTAANYLWVGLRNLLPRQAMVNQMSEPLNLDLWIDAWRQRAIVAAEVTAAAANLYLSGIAVVNEGADWVFTINELSQGHWEAAVGFLPFATASLPAVGRVIIRGADDVLATVDQPAMQAILAAKQQSSFAARWQTLSQIDLAWDVRVALLRSGFIRGPRSNLAQNLIAAGQLPPTHFLKPEAHHRIPHAQDIRKHCELVGIDVDAASIDGVDLGRWVEGGPHGPHQKWSAEHLNEWRAWFAEHPNATRQEVLNVVDQIDDPAHYRPYGEWP